MESVSFKLEIFEGPLDLLLSLIGKNKIDICDINISEILKQYIDYLNLIREMRLEVTADFLAMASQLMYIKSRSLLPKNEEDEEEDPKEALVRALEEYRRCKEAALILSKRIFENGELFVKQADVLPKTKNKYDGQHDSQELYEAFLRVYKKAGRRMPPPVNSFSGIVGREPVPVEGKLTFMLKELAVKKWISFMKLIKQAKSRSEIVATFLALLELTRSKRINIENDENNKSNYVIRMAEDGE